VSTSVTVNAPCSVQVPQGRVKKNMENSIMGPETPPKYVSMKPSGGGGLEDPPAPPLYIKKISISKIDS